MNFEWDTRKAEKNVEKHLVPFEEATSIFDDPLYIDFYDPEHSEAEHRYIRVGQSNQNRILVVSYTERGEKIRLISARRATNSERKAYEES